MNNWEQVQQLQVNAYVERLLSSFDIKETTTDRQLKNGTRIFKYGDEFFGVYKSGMVRKIIRTTLFNESSCYQLNLTRKRKTDYMFFEDNNKLTVRTYETVKRVPIVQELGRLVYLTEYLIKNRGMKKKGKEFRKILAEISGYTEQELTDRHTEPLIQPCDCLLAISQAITKQN